MRTPAVAAVLILGVAATLFAQPNPPKSSTSTQRYQLVSADLGQQSAENEQMTGGNGVGLFLLDTQTGDVWRYGITHAGIPLEMQNAAAVLNERLGELRRQLADAQKRGDDEAAAAAEKKLEAIEHRLDVITRMGQAQEGFWPVRVQRIKP